MGIKTTQKIDFPQGYLTTEDKVSMIARLSALEIAEKNANTNTYSKKYDAAIAALLASVTTEVEALDGLLFNSAD